jgi:hypothetical protein
MHFPTLGDRADAQKEAEEDWFRASFCTELAMSDFPDPFHFHIGARPPLFSGMDAADLSGSDSQPIVGSPSVVTPPPVFGRDPLPQHKRYVSQPLSVEGFGSAGSAPSAQPVPSMPKVFSYTKRSQGPRQITGAVDQEFLRLCLDCRATFNPHHLGFIPSSAWTDAEVRFGDLVTDFFQRKNNANCRFSHKLYNALRITRSDRFYFHYIGVEWLSQDVMKVDKHIFAQLLGIKSVDGSLFHQQGNFPSHGFVELGRVEAMLQPFVELEGIDFDKMRLLVHQDHIFVKDASETNLLNCTWVHARHRI